MGCLTQRGMQVPGGGEVAWLLPGSGGSGARDKPYWRGTITALRYGLLCFQREGARLQGLPDALVLFYAVRPMHCWEQNQSIKLWTNPGVCRGG